MRTAVNALRIALAGVLGTGALVAALASLAVYSGFHAPGTALVDGAVPAGHELHTLLLIVAASLAAVGVYAAWFDRLFAGPAAVRGAKFGVVVWIWHLAFAALVYQHGFAGLDPAQPMRSAIAALGAWTLFGTIVGIVYGSGRRYDAYTWGLGYGVSDRPTLA
jgi:hypothetical protein